MLVNYGESPTLIFAGQRDNEVAAMVLLVILVYWLVVGSTAAYVALFVPDEQRATRAFDVLKHVTRFGLGASAVAVLVKSMDKAADLLPLLGR